MYSIRWVGVLLGVLWLAFVSLTAHRAAAATSQTINFQARLMQSSGAIVPDGTYNVEFKLYNTLSSSGSSAGSCTGDASCLWFERYSGANKISVANGYLTVELGSLTALPSIDWSQNLYLTMNIGGTDTSPVWDGEMSPRLHLTAVPHAFTADQLSNTNGSFTSTLGFTAPTASRSILLPDEAGTLCIQSSANCGFAASTGSTSYIQNQNASDQTANFRISGSGRATTSFLAPLFDTATAATLNIGTTNATAINLNKSTTITGGITQSGGTISLAGNAASSITTSTGALTLTAAGSSNWTVGGTNQSLTITTSGTGTLTLGTTGAGTVTVGSSSATINIGATNNARTVHIADGGTSTTQTVIAGSTNGSSSTTIQGGTGATAIALTTGTNGKIAINSQGTGGVNANIGSNGFVLNTTTNTSEAFVVKDSGSLYIFSVSTSTGTVTMGAIQATYSGFDGTLDTPFGDLTLGSANTSVKIKGDTGTTWEATSGSFTTTVGFTAPTANRTVTIADESGTICIRNSANCGFAASSGSANYIQNTTTAQSANMYVQAATSGSVAAVLQANAAGTGDIINLRNGAGTNVATIGSAGATLFKNSTNSSAAFTIQNAAGTALFNVDTTSNGLLTIGTALRLNVTSANATTFTTPLASSVPTAINIPLYNPGAYGQLVAMGLPSTADSTARAISVFDARTSGTIQPAIALFSPNENDVFGLSWNGLNTTASLETASAAIALRPGGVNVKLWAGSTGVAIGANVSSAAYPLDVTGDVNTSTQYRIGGTVICTSTGCTPAAGSANYIQNGITAQSANMYVQAATSGSVAATIRANAAGAGNILDLKNGAGTNVATFSSTGSALFKTSTDSTTALQVQSNGGTTALNVDTTNARVGIGGIVAPAVSLDVQGAIQQTGLTTSNTNGTDNNKWTLLGTCTITTQYNQCITAINIMGGHDGNGGDNTQATVTARVKQQNALGGVPYVNVTLNNTAEIITKDDIVAVTTQNDGTATVVQLYGRITLTYEQWYFTPVLNSDQSPSKWAWSQSAGFLAALPAGAQTAAVYGNSYANTLTVQPAANVTNAFQVKNAAGNNTAFSVDTGNLRVAVGGTFNPQETVDVVGNLQVRDATTATKSYRLRTSGGGLDFEGAGANLVLSIWSGASYTGTQYNQITFKNDGSSMDFARGFNVSDGAAKVGLGGNVAPNYPLDVTGDVNTSTQYRIGGTVICTSTGCTPAAGSANYIQNGTTVQVSSNFNISGTGVAGTALQAPLIDTATAATLSIGTTNATTVSIANNNAAHTINIGNGGTSTVQTVNVGSTFGGSATTIQGGTGTSAIALTTGSGGNIKLTTTGTGSVNVTPGSSGMFVQPTADSTAAFQVLAGGSGNSVLRVDTTNERVGVGVISDPIGAKLSVATASTVSLRAYQGGASDSFQLGNATADFLTVGSTGNFLLKPTSNSASAFRIQNSGGAATLFTVDTSGNNIQIGSSTTDTTAVLLTLDSYSTSTDPTGIAGAMYYSTAYNAMRCYQDGAWSNCSDPTRLSHGYNIQEDFFGSDDSDLSTYCNGTTAIVASYGWSCWNGGTSTVGYADMVAADLSTRLGQIQLATSTSASGNESLYLGGGVTSQLFIGGGESFETAINIPTLSNGTQTYVIRTGLCDNNNHAQDCVDGVYFEYSSASSANWRINTALGSTRTKTTTSKAVATGWTNLKWVATSSSNITFYVKSAGETSYTNVGSITTNIPTSSSNATSLMMLIDKTAGTTERTFKVDYVDYWRDFTTNR